MATNIDELIAALNRATATGQTDDEQRNAQIAYRFGSEFITLCGKFAAQHDEDTDGLDLPSILVVVAGILGISIKASGASTKVRLKLIEIFATTMAKEALK